jgi:hypothetical protein
MLLKCPEAVDESFPLLPVVGQITIELDVNAAAAQLPVQVTQHHQFVCAGQDVCRPGQIGDGLDGVDLIQKFAPRSHNR